MPIEFNSDGSIKLPGVLQQKKDERERVFNSVRVVRFVRRAISDYPLIDDLEIYLSKNIEDPHMLELLFDKAKGLFRHEAQIRLEKRDEREYVVRIISGLYRDSWLAEFRAFVCESFNAKVQYESNNNDFRKGKKF